jgi:RpiR family transcriptional regulator, carbohydrate utilization regulator
MKRKAVPKHVSAQNTAPLPSLGCFARIRARAGSFTRIEQKIAQLIEKDPHSIILSSAREIADRCGVSEAAVSRISQRIGYSGFPELKVSLAQDLVGPDQTVHEDMVAGDDVEAVKQKATAATIQALNDTAAVLDNASIAAATELLFNAERIVFCGVGGSGILTLDAKHSFMRTGKTVLAFNDAHEQGMIAALSTPADVFVLISHSGATRDLIEVAEIARERRAKTIAITHLGTPPLGRISDVHLMTSARETLYRPESLSSRIAALNILDILYVCLGQRMNKTMLKNLNAIRSALKNKRV